MKIVICGSIEITPEIKEISDELIKIGHKTEIPLTSQKIIKGELTMKEFKQEKKNNGDGSFRKIEDDLIKRYYRIIDESDAVLILNIDKNGIKNYIGGNTFLEMAFAHVLDKEIFLYNGIPQMSYTDEIIAMQPMIINQDLSKIASF